MDENALQEQALDEWVKANLRYLAAACGTQMPQADAGGDNGTEQ